MVHGTPTYDSITGTTLDIIPPPAEVQAYLDELTAQPEPANTAPPMHGTIDSIYAPENPGNPALRP